VLEEVPSSNATEIGILEVKLTGPEQPNLAEVSPDSLQIPPVKKFDVMTTKDKFKGLVPFLVTKLTYILNASFGKFVL
jgi:hypothetical protein